MTNQTPKPKGGKREGAGRKPSGSPMRVYSLMLPESLLAYVKVQGGSAFVRKLIEDHHENRD